MKFPHNVYDEALKIGIEATSPQSDEEYALVEAGVIAVLAYVERMLSLPEREALPGQGEAQQ